MMTRMADLTPAARLEEARQQVGADIFRGARAVSALAQLTGYVDSEMRRLAAAAGPPGRAALIAVGGYGRRHLCPYFGVDMLVVFEHGVGDAEERYLRDLLQPMWDAGFVVGHQVRELGELTEPDRRNPEFLVAVTDARFVAGDEPLFGRAAEAFRTPRTRAAATTTCSGTRCRKPSPRRWATADRRRSGRSRR